MRAHPQFLLPIAIFTLLLATPAEAQTAPLRIVSISGVSPTHSLTPDGIEVLHVDVENTTDAPSAIADVRCSLGLLRLRARAQPTPPRGTTRLTLRVSRAARNSVPSGGEFARCSLYGVGASEVTTMVYTGPALVPNLRFSGAGIEVRDCETFEAPTAGHPVCVYLDPENTAQTVGAIAEVRVTTRCELGTTRVEEVRALRDFPTGENGARGAGEDPPVFQLGRLTRGTHVLSCSVDADGGIEETDERDNLRRVSIVVQDILPRRYDVAIIGLSARYLPFRGHEAPQPDQVVLDVALLNAGDAILIGGHVDCVIDGAPHTAGFGGFPPPHGVAPAARFRAYISMALARNERPPSHLTVSCRARIDAPTGVTDANPSNDDRAGRLAVQQ